MSVVRIEEVKSSVRLMRIIARYIEGSAELHVKALKAYIRVSQKVYAGIVDDDIVCVWGVIRQSLLSDRGYMWLMVTERADEHKFLIVRHSQRIIEELKKDYSILCGECLLDNHKAQKWMKLLGASFSFPEGNTVPFQIVR